MKQLNETIYNKLLVSAEEARDQGMQKLASGVLGALTDNPELNKEKYSSGQLETDVYEGLWKLATNVVKYHEIESADIEKINEVIETLAGKFVEQIERSVGIEPGTMGKAEPPVWGEIIK